MARPGSTRSSFRVAVRGDLDEAMRRRVRDAVQGLDSDGSVHHVSIQFWCRPDRELAFAAHAVLHVDGRILHERTSAVDLDSCLLQLLLRLSEALRLDRLRRRHARLVDDPSSRRS